jgi:hypothetical protein
VVGLIRSWRVSHARRDGEDDHRRGFTTTRTLEWVGQKMGRIAPDRCAPLYLSGYCFRAIDELLTISIYPVPAASGAALPVLVCSQGLRKRSNGNINQLRRCDVII